MAKDENTWPLIGTEVALDPILEEAVHGQAEGTSDCRLSSM